jgi:hypothetical protein
VVLASARPSFVGPDRSHAGATRAERPAGAILRDRDNKVVGTLTIEVLGGQIQTIRSVIKPNKLKHVDPVADAWAVVRELSGLAGPRIDRKSRLRSRHVKQFQRQLGGTGVD